MAGDGDLGQHPSAQRRGGDRGHGDGQPGGDRLQPPRLHGTDLAVGQVALEAAPLGLHEGIHGVGAGESMNVVLAHDPTPRQSRSRISPSRRRVFTVPSGTSSRSATSR